MMQKRRAACLGLVIALVSTGAPALAQPADTAAAEFDAAQKLFDVGRQAEALPHFRKALEASKSPNARLMVARCLIAIGKTAEAYEEMALTTREATARADADAKYAPTRDAAAAELALLERRVGKIVVALAEPGPGAVVKLNGAPLAADRLGVPVAVEPGQMVIEASRPGDQPVRREVKVGAGETKTVAIALVKAGGTPAGPDKPGPALPSNPEQTSRGGGVRIAGVIVAILGAGGMGAFVGAGLVSKSKFATLEKECGKARCTDPKYGSIVDSGKTMDTVANIGLGVGIAGIVGGGLMIALGGPKKVPASAAVTVTPSGTGLRIDGTF